VIPCQTDSAEDNPRVPVGLWKIRRRYTCLPPSCDRSWSQVRAHPGAFVRVRDSGVDRPEIGTLARERERYENRQQHQNHEPEHVVGAALLAPLQSIQ
jgi:hypothetical protein